MATNRKYSDAGLNPKIVAPSTLVSGTPIKIGAGLYGVPLTDAASGEDCGFARQGIFDLPKVGGSGITFALGAKVYWNASSGKCTATTTDDLIGRCTKAAVDADTTVEVAFNGEVAAVSNLDGSQVATVANSTTVGGALLMIPIAVPAAAATTSVTVTHKLRFVNALCVKTVQAGTAGGTLTVKNGANAITDAITWDNTIADKAIKFPGTIDDAYYEIAAGGTLSVTTSQAASDGVVYVTCYRVA